MNAAKEWFEVDYYAVLSVEKFSDGDVVTRAYRSLAKILHPDASGGSEEAFKEISSAYAVLGNAEKKALYDQCQRLVSQKEEEEKRKQAPEPPQKIKPILPNGANRRQQVILKVKEAITGCQKLVRVEKSTLCQMCDGRGSPLGSLYSQCAVCQGTGILGVDGADNVPYICWECYGRGVLAAPRCAVCHGRGTLEEATDITIKIPANVTEGRLIRVDGYGYASVNGDPGSLYLEISIEENSVLRRVGNDLYSVLPISVSEAVMGGTFEVMGLEPLVLSVPPGTQGGRGFLLSGKGVPKEITGEDPGNLFITIQVVVPTNLERRVQKLVLELDKFYEKPVREDYHL